MRSLQ